MKKRNLNTNDTNQTEYENPNRSSGERFFSIIMSVILLGIVVFYISLPIKALTYNDKKQPNNEQDNSLVVDNGSESDKNTETSKPDQAEKPVVEDENESDTEQKPETQKPEAEKEETKTEETEKPETNTSTGSEQKYDKYAVVTYDGLNVRTDTTSNADSIGKAPLNAKLPVLEEYSEYTWVKVLFNGKEGFVHTDFVEYVTE